MMDVDELAERVRPWAEANMPEAWAKTREQASRPASYRKFLARLITRWYQSGARDIPLAVLQESDLRIKMRTRAAKIEFEVCGRYAEGEQKVDFRMLELMAAENGVNFENVLRVTEEFDAVIDRSPPKPLPPYRVPPKEPAPAPVVVAKKREDPSVILELLPPEFRSRDG